MKKGEEFEALITELRYPNRGRCVAEGIPVTVKNALPGQKVRFRVIKKRDDQAEGRLLAVTEASPLETDENRCALYPACGGCLMLTLPYKEQLRIKEAQIKNLLAEVSDPETVFDPILPSPEIFAYRNKMEFSFGDETPGGPLTLGLHKTNSRYDILNVSDCRLIHPDMQMILDMTLAYCRARELKAFHRTLHTGFLRHLLLRRSATDGSLLVFIVTTDTEREDFSAWLEQLLELPLKGRISGVFHGINKGVADVVRAEETRCLFGTDALSEALLGLRFSLSAFSFFQTNTRAAEKLYEKVRAYLHSADIPEAPVIYDLYSGTGTIAQILSPVAREVYAIEIVEEAVRAAERNAEANGIRNCHFICGDVLETLDAIPLRPDVLVLDPPREGLHPKALKKLMRYEVRHMIYISCKATSFVRDMREMRKYGWRVKRVCPADLFPHTQHVEVVCLLSNRKDFISAPYEAEDAACQKKDLSESDQK